MLANFAVKRKLEEATSSQDDVTPVYVLDDIWNLVNTASTDIGAMIDMTNRRLANKSPTVKAKTLRLVKFICGKGASEYKRGLAKNAGPVRELLHYRGEPDPFKGDVPNQKVREAAKEALDAVFAPTDTTHHIAQTQPAYQARIQGFGSSNAHTSDSGVSGPSNASTAGNANWGGGSGVGGGSSTASSSKMVGFGNPRFEATKPPAGKGQSVAQNMLNSKTWEKAATSAANAASQLASRGQAAWNLKSIHGLMRDEDKTGYSSGEEGSYVGPAATSTSNGAGVYSTPAGSSPLAASSAAAAAAAHSAEGEEVRLVDSICTPGGLRAQPDKADLKTFVESLGNNLDGELLVALLTSKMEQGPWQATLRAVCALEAVIETGHTEVCGRIAVAFQTEPSALQKAANLPLASLRQRAAKVLGLLGVDAPAQAAAGRKPGPAAAPAAPAAAVPDLMGGFDDEQASASAPAASGADMLGDLMGPEGASAGTAQPADLFIGMSAPSAFPQAQHAGSDMFSGLATSPPAHAPPSDPFAVSATQSTPAPQAQPDFMAGFGAPEPAQNGFPAPSPVPSVFSSSGPAPDMFGGANSAGRQGGPSSNGGASAADDALAGLFTGLSTDAHGSQAGIPGLVKAGSHAAPRLGQLLSQGSGSGSGNFGQSMGPGLSRLGSSPGPRPASPMMPAQHGGFPNLQGGVHAQQSSVPYALGQPTVPSANGMQPAFGMQPGMMPHAGPSGAIGMQSAPWQQQQQHMQMAQLQQAQYMQHMAMVQQQQQQQQMMHGGLAAVLPFQQQQQLGMGLQQPQQLGLGYGMPGALAGPTGSAIPADTFQGLSSSSTPHAASSSKPSSKEFDFVGEHLSTLRRK